MVKANVTELVECLSDIEYAERPVALYWQGERLEILQVIAGWRTPEAKWFRVLTGEQQIFELGYTYASDAWSVIQC
jgi:hypothetical protein